MQRKWRSLLTAYIILAGVILAGVIALAVPYARQNANLSRLKDNILAVDTAQSAKTSMTQIATFAWDRLYVFAAGTDSDEITRVIGAGGSALKSTDGADVTKLVFMNGKSVVCAAAGRQKSAQYLFDFGDTPQEGLVFTRDVQIDFYMDDAAGVRILTYIPAQEPQT